MDASALITAAMMAVLALGSAALIGRDLLIGADRISRMIGGGILAASLLIGIGFYMVYGSFGTPDAPLSSRQAEIAAAQQAKQESQVETESALALAIADARRTPGDIETQFALAEAAARAGDSQLEIATLKVILDETGNPAVMAMIGEALSREAGGIITQQALDWIDQALAENPNEWRARYLKGLHHSQAGDDQRAFEVWLDLAEDTVGTPVYPAVAGAVSAAADKLGLDASTLLPQQDDAVGAPDIAAMVAGLEERLLEEDAITDHAAWQMLIRSYVTLGETGRRDQRLDDLLARLPDGGTDPEADLTLLIRITEMIMPPDNLPEVIPPVLDRLMAKARTIQEQHPSVLFFSGLMARSQGNEAGLKQWWGQLRAMIDDENPLAALLDNELSRTTN